MIKKEKGGVKTSVSGPRSIPASSKFMDGKTNPVPRGTGGMRSGGARKPKALPEHVRLGNFGKPAGHMTKGHDGTGMERKAMRPGATPANMDGKNNPVPKGGRGRKGTPVDNANRINRGKPWGARTIRDLASKL